MGRPWWYDSYWQSNEQQRRSKLPGRKFWVWTAVVALALLLTAGRTGFQPMLVPWLVLFAYHFCRILFFTILIRAILSWFNISPYNIFIRILDDITRPILSPLRRIVPRIGMIDITPLAAMLLLWLTSFLILHFAI